MLSKFGYGDLQDWLKMLFLGIAMLAVGWVFNGPFAHWGMMGTAFAACLVYMFMEPIMDEHPGWFEGPFIVGIFVLAYCMLAWMLPLAAFLKGLAFLMLGVFLLHVVFRWLLMGMQLFGMMDPPKKLAHR